jgi:hypothetical protein
MMNQGRQCPEMLDLAGVWRIMLEVFQQHLLLGERAF